MILTVGIFLILGFLLAWVVGVVSSEEISIGKGFGLALQAVLVGIFACMFARTTPVSAVAPLAGGLVGGAALMLVVRVWEKTISWKHAAIIGAVYGPLIGGICWMAF